MSRAPGLPGEAGLRVDRGRADAPGPFRKRGPTGIGGPVAPNTECKVIDVVTGDELGPGERARSGRAARRS